MRGQVTAFAIIGVLMLIAVLSLFWIARAPNTEPETQRPNLDLETCIEERAGGAILDIGLWGGRGELEIGSRVIGDVVADRLGLASTDKTQVALVPWLPSPFADYPITPRHELKDGRRTATNRFPQFSEMSSAMTTLIEDRVETCKPDQGDLSLTSVTYSDENIRIETRVIEQGRSPREAVVTLPIPIRTYHRILAAAVREDSINPSFRFSTLSTPGVSITTIPMENTNNDTVLVLRTDRPVIGSEPYRFLTIILERPPVFLGERISDGTVSCANDDTVSYTGLLSQHLLDPDDDHTPEIECEWIDTNTVEYTLTSAGNDYTFEATP